MSMVYEAIKDQKVANAWRVEAINYDHDGEIYVTVFFDPKAEQRALTYAETMNSSQPGRLPAPRMFAASK